MTKEESNSIEVGDILLEYVNDITYKVIRTNMYETSRGDKRDIPMIHVERVGDGDFINKVYWLYYSDLLSPCYTIVKDYEEEII
jgi:hypothetical protein